MKIASLTVQFILFASLFLASQTSQARHAAILIDASNGNVLYELEANQSWYPASLTKLMTLYMTFEALESGRLRLDRHLGVSGHAAKQPTSKLGLRPWQSISVEDAIIAIVTRSANDAAVVLGESIGGSEQQFAVKMTTTAHRLGMLGSHFMNATGLPHDWQTTTAHDMGLLAMRLIRDFPQYYSYFGVDSMYFNGREYRSINKFTNYYPGAEGMKTGYTCGSGYNLVATANQYGKRLIGVVLGGMTSSERYEHMFMMMDMGFSNPNSGFRSKNINTMSKFPIGNPPYQLSCGRRPTSHYARHAPDIDDEDENDDDRKIQYVKKYRDSSLIGEHKPKILAKPRVEEAKPRVVYAAKRHEPAHLVQHEHVTPLRSNKHGRNSAAERQPPKALTLAHAANHHEKTAAVKTRSNSKTTKAEKPLKVASREKTKGYYVPPVKKPEKSGKDSAKSNSSSKHIAKASPKSKKPKGKS